MTHQARIALKAAHLRYNLGKVASKSYAVKNGCSPRLYRLACQLLAAHKGAV